MLQKEGRRGRCPSQGSLSRLCTDASDPLGTDKGKPSDAHIPSQTCSNQMARQLLMNIQFLIFCSFVCLYIWNKNGNVCVCVCVPHILNWSNLRRLLSVHRPFKKKKIKKIVAEVSHFLIFSSVVLVAADMDSSCKLWIYFTSTSGRLRWRDSGPFIRVHTAPSGATIGFVQHICFQCSSILQGP